MSTGVIVLLVVVPLALAFGLYRMWADGRFRGTHAVKGATSGATGETESGGGSVPDDHVVAIRDALGETPLGEKATLLQFSSAFCAPCRATRRVLGDIAEVVPGVTHVEVDAESHLELVRRLNVVRTPTTIVLDASGAEHTRAAGAPNKQQVLAALASID